MTETQMTETQMTETQMTGTQMTETARRQGMATTDGNLEHARAELTERLAELRRTTASTADDRKPVELDQSSVGRLSRMDALQMQAMAQATERRRAQEAARIEAALRRIDDGEYGWCVTCGEAIAPKRLAADPTVPTCIHCASAGER